MLNLRDKKVVVIGLGISGFAACRLLAQQGAKVSISDCQDNDQVRKNLDKLDRKNIEKIELGQHSEELIKGQELAVISPGVSSESLAFVWAREKGIPVIAEIELAFSLCPARIVAITGTNGKTTVSALAGEVFQQAGFKTVVCGNIGTAFSAEIGKITNEHIVVVEVSSFQLEAIAQFKPKVAAVLNLSNDHLDRYSSFDEYVSAKSRIFSNQDGDDWALLNQDDANVRKLAVQTKARVAYFSRENFSNSKFQQLNNNHFAALGIAAIFKIPEAQAVKTCRNFSGIEHRLEEITQVQGVKFINDSKATNVDSTLWALKSITAPIVLIAGGRDKGSSFAAHKEEIQKQVKAMVLIGEATEKLVSVFRDLVSIKTANTLEQAVAEAFALANAGDCVLLSPMCASFDMFNNYEERGKAFKAVVAHLTTVRKK